QRDPVVNAVTARNGANAGAGTGQRAARWERGEALPPTPRRPAAVKDPLAPKDMPSQRGGAAVHLHSPHRRHARAGGGRHGGARLLAKTVTGELGGSEPGPTTNPFDPKRTPGGSSSGSAAAVGANMVPAAIGTQVGGSIIRPAAYCGNFALKPTQGG